jgi:hypothetical protein
VKLVSLKRPKAACFPSYADYKAKTNAAILCNMTHTKERSLTGRKRQGKEIKNIDVVDVLTV